jgi:hypothetical protein
MASAPQLRRQIEAALANRIPSALTPAPRVVRPTAPTGITALDEALGGGLPLGAISELAGPECSGRTSLALSFLAGFTRAGQVCAWVDVSDTLHPESAAAIGVDLARLLWIRCGTPAEQLTLPGFDDEQQRKIKENSPASGQNQKKVSVAVTNFDAEQNFAPCCAEPQPTVRKKSREVVPPAIWVPHPTRSWQGGDVDFRPKKPWTRLDQALRATDLLLQAGGFAAIVFDMGSVAPEFALRIPLATWFRYRAAAERSQASVLLITQQACTKSSAGVVLHCESGSIAADSTTVLTGAESLVTIARKRFAKVSEFTRKPPQSSVGSAIRFEREQLPSNGHSSSIRWQTQTPWAALRPMRPQKSGRA